jgi:hypothetical protein
MARAKRRRKDRQKMNNGQQAVDELRSAAEKVITALTQVLEAYGAEPVSVFKWLRADHVMAVLDAHRGFTQAVQRLRPLDGLWCTVTREQLAAMAAEHRCRFAGLLVPLLQPAASYSVTMPRLLELAVNMHVLGELEQADPGEQHRPHNAPLVAQLSPARSGPVPTQAAPAPAAPAPAAPAPAPPSDLPPTPVLDGGQFEGMTDDEVIASVTAGGGSSGGMPQPPNQLPVQHPLIQQQQSGPSGPPPGFPVGPTPQQLKAMRRKIENGD